MQKKSVMVVMMVLFILATTSCTDIAGIGSDYYLRGHCGNDPSAVFSEKQPGANYVAVDATNVYWTNRFDGRVMKMGIDDGSVVEIAGGQGGPRCIAVDATHVYWTNVDDGRVMRVAIDGSNLTILAMGQNKPYDIVVTDEFIFWTNEGTEPPKPPGSPLLDGEIKRLERFKTDPIPNPPPMPTTLVPSLNYPQAIAADAEHLYWTDADYLMRTGFDGMERIQIAPLPYSPILNSQLSDLAVTGNGIFWTDTDNNKVNKVGITGSKLVQLAANDQTPFGIAVDATHVYWTSSHESRVYKVGIDGGEATLLAEGQGWPVGIAVDETCVYWANRNDGKVMKVAKEKTSP